MNRPQTIGRLLPFEGGVEYKCYLKSLGCCAPIWASLPHSKFRLERLWRLAFLALVEGRTSESVVHEALPPAVLAMLRR